LAEQLTGEVGKVVSGLGFDTSGVHATLRQGVRITNREIGDSRRVQSHCRRLKLLAKLGGGKEPREVLTVKLGHQLGEIQVVIGTKLTRALGKLGIELVGTEVGLTQRLSITQPALHKVQGRKPKVTSLNIPSKTKTLTDRARLTGCGTSHKVPDIQWKLSSLSQIGTGLRNSLLQKR